MRHFQQRKNSHYLQQQIYRDVVEADDSTVQLRHKFYPAQQQQAPTKNQPIKNSRYEGSTDSEDARE